MDNYELTRIVEKRLEKRIRIRRRITVIVCILFFILGIVFSVLYLQSRTVVEHDLGFIKHEVISYNSSYLCGFVPGFCISLMAVILFIYDLALSKVHTVEVNGNYVTFYRGMVHTQLYVNGEYRDGLSFIGFYLEATLPDMTKVTVSLGKYSAHLSFSNGLSSIDI